MIAILICVGLAAAGALWLIADDGTLSDQDAGASGDNYRD